MSLPTVFLSHSGQDNVWCECVANHLKGVGFDIFFDKRSLEGGDHWMRILETELPARDVFLLILSPDAWTSIWVQKEIELAFQSRRRIIPVMHRPTQVTGFLTTIQIIDAVNRECDLIAPIISDLLQGKRNAPPSFPVPPSMLKVGYTEKVVDRVRHILPPTCAIPAGPFIMGSDQRRDPAAYPDEMPQFQLTLPDYRLAAFPVSVAEYACAVVVGAVLEPVMSATHPIAWADQMQRLDAPVVGVDWANALAYANWLTRQTGQAWALPTEAEWEKAARGTDGRIFPWGNTWDVTKANTQMSGLGKPVPVGKYFNSSVYGAFDMVGNIWEWTRTAAKPYPYNAHDGRDDLTDMRVARVVRGGSWANGNLAARVAFRLAEDPDSGAADRGFRLRTV